MQDGKYLKLISSTYKTVKAESNILADIADAFTDLQLQYFSIQEIYCF